MITNLERAKNQALRCACDTESKRHIEGLWESFLKTNPKGSVAEIERAFDFFCNPEPADSQVIHRIVRTIEYSAKIERTFKAYGDVPATQDHPKHQARIEGYKVTFKDDTGHDREFYLTLVTDLPAGVEK